MIGSVGALRLHLFTFVYEFSWQVNGDIPNEYEFPLSLSHIKNMISSFGTKSEETSDPGPGSDDSRKKKE